MVDEANQVRLLLASAVLLTSLSLVSSTAAAEAPTATGAPIQVRFLFDLGDGTYHWANATILDPNATNATWDSMQSAAARIGLWIRWSWYSGSFGSGVFISDLGNRSPPNVALFLWDAGNAVWAPSPVGITNVVLSNGAAVALADTGYNPATYNPYPPAPTPDHPYPAAEFRADTMNSGVSSSLFPDGLQVLWDRRLVTREIESAPAVVAGRVFILTLDGLFALDETSGTTIWTNPRISGLSTPAFYNGTLLVDGSDGRVHAVDVKNGVELWNITLLSTTSFSGITSSPKLLFDQAFLGTFNESGGPGEVVALGAVNGTVLWKHPAPGSVSFSSPAVANDTVFVGIIGRYNTSTHVTYDPPFGVLALDAATGAQRWFVPLGASVAASPVYAEGVVYTPAKDGYVYALDAGTGALEWKVAVNAGVSSPAFHAGTLFVGGGSSSFDGAGEVTALDATSGSVKWTFHPNGVVQSSVTYAGGMIVFSTNTANGTVYALDATRGDVVWSYTPAPAQYIFGSPVVADGMVFAPSDNGHVYAIGVLASLVRLDVSAPASVEIDQNVTLTVTLDAVAGRVGNATLVMALRGFEILSSNTPYASPSADFYEWSLGAIPFLGSQTITIRARGACLPAAGGGCVTGPQSDAANVVNYGVTGVRHPDATVYFVVSLSTASPTPSTAVWAYALVAAGVILAAAGIAFFVFRRRRSSRGP